VVLEGQWHSEEYFRDIAPRIREEFSIRPALSAQTQAIAKEIATDPASVSIHIRKLHGYSASGKQVGLPGFRCGSQHYERALNQIEARTGKVHAYVFADGRYGLEDLRLPITYRVVNHNGPERDYEDLHLMSLCRHHIIANSTFSWWAAWLGTYAGTVVCAPKNFYPHFHKLFALPVRDAYPAGWLVI
jgi:hypothetical protein